MISVTYSRVVSDVVPPPPSCLPRGFASEYGLEPERIVPDEGVETFPSRVVWVVDERVEADAEGHTAHADVLDQFEEDSDPDAELRQKLPRNPDSGTGRRVSSNCGFPSPRMQSHS